MAAPIAERAALSAIRSDNSEDPWVHHALGCVLAPVPARSTMREKPAPEKGPRRSVANTKALLGKLAATVRELGITLCGEVQQRSSWTRMSLAVVT